MNNVLIDSVLNNTEFATTVIDRNNLGRYLSTLSDGDFYMYLYGLTRNPDGTQGDFLDKINFLDENDVSRILYGSFMGISNYNQNNELYFNIILPTFFWCIRESRLYLIPPGFNLLRYMSSIDFQSKLENISYTAHYIAAGIISYHALDIDEYYSLTDYNLDYQRLDMSPEEIIVTKISSLGSRFILPYMKMILNDSFNNCYDTFVVELSSSLTTSLKRIVNRLGIKDLISVKYYDERRNINLDKDGAFNQLDEASGEVSIYHFMEYLCQISG